MIAIIASSDLWPTPEVVAAVGTVILSTEEPVGIRVDKKLNVTSHVEAAVLQIAATVGREVVFFPPQGAGRESVYERDYQLAERSSRVYAYFAPGQEMEGGTGHVVKAALDRGIDVEAFRLDNEGNVELLGSEERE